MKAIVSAAVTAQGLTTSYSGNSRKMFIKGKGSRRVMNEMREQFPDAPFKIMESAK